MFEKGNTYGTRTRFTSENQPQKRGRKPSLFKQLKAMTKAKVGYELEKGDYFEIIRWIMEATPKQIEVLITDPNNPKKPNPDTPLWLLNIITAINMDIRLGRTNTIEMVFDRVFGKATQPIEAEVFQTSEVDELTEEQMEAEIARIDNELKG